MRLLNCSVPVVKNRIDVMRIGMLQAVQTAPILFHDPVCSRRDASS